MKGLGEKSGFLDELKAMKQRVDLLFAEHFKEAAPESGEERQGVGEWQPLADVFETEEEWCMSADLPGVADDDLQVELAEKYLTIKGRRETHPAFGGSGSSQLECPEGHFCRTFSLPQNVKKDAIQAELKRGVLTVRVPKSASSEASFLKIEVSSG